MSKTIVMNDQAQHPTRAIRVDQRPAKLILEIDKEQLGALMRKLAVAGLFVILAVLLLTTYKSNSFQFWPLLKVAVILSIVALVSNLSNNNS